MKRVRYLSLILVMLFTTACGLFDGLGLRMGLGNLREKFSRSNTPSTEVSVQTEQTIEEINFKNKPTTDPFATPEDVETGPSLSITYFEEIENGKSIIHWDAVGSFPEGYKVVWSQDNPNPAYPADIWDHIANENARSAEVFGKTGQSYYFRVCKFANGGCEFYSNPVAYTFRNTSETLTPSQITITNIENTELNKARISWSANGSFPEGFKIVWSQTNAQPTFPGDSNTYVSDPAARSATIQGKAGETYNFRICKYLNGECSAYSSPYTFTFATSTSYTPDPKSIQITNIANAGTGKATVYWTAEGSFPKGFKVVWSKTNSNPVYPGDSNVYLSSSSARSATVEGSPGYTYYFRVCEYTGSGCGVYSNSYKYTYPSAPTKTPDTTSTITITNIEKVTDGKALVSWTASGNFPYGFKVVYSKTHPNPVYPGDSYVYLSDPNTRSTKVTGDVGSTYYFRVCQYLGGSCGVYSNSYKYTFTGTPANTPTPDGSTISITSVTDVSEGKAMLSWTASGDFPKGFKVIWSETDTSPVYPGDGFLYLSDPAARSTLVEGLGGHTYYYRVCKYTDSGCTIYSGTYTFTFAASPAPTMTPTATATATPTATATQTSLPTSTATATATATATTTPEPTLTFTPTP
jgi:hypothetical protein